MKPDYVLFPDASLRRTKTGNYAGYACAILNPETMGYVTIAAELSKNATIVSGEAWAAYRGLQFIRVIQQRESKEKLNVLVVSDSKLLVSTFNEWIGKSWITTDWYHWKKRDGSTVKNQELYRAMLRVMQTGNLTVRFVHINSHSDKKAGLKKYIAHKMKQSKVRLTDSQLDVFIHLNSVADKAATEVTQKMIEQEGMFDHLVWLKPPCWLKYP